MPKHYCDYCDVFLTHDSASVRKAHNSGRNHLANVRDYYASLGHDKAQNIIDQITQAYESGTGPPPGGFGFTAASLGTPMPTYGPPQFGPPPAFNPMMMSGPRYMGPPGSNGPPPPGGMSAPPFPNGPGGPPPSLPPFSPNAGPNGPPPGQFPPGQGFPPGNPAVPSVASAPPSGSGGIHPDRLRNFS